MVDGKLHHFSAGGLYNGLVLLVDDETGSYWDHITGECVHGPLAGKQLQTFYVPLTTVKAALERDPDLLVSRSRPSLFARVMARVASRQVRGKGFFPPGFRGTMGPADTRLPEHVSGLGITIDGSAKFYPVSRLSAGPVTDTLAGHELTVVLDPVDRVPRATLATGEMPMQLFTRWYGFAYSYPGCAIFGASAGEPG